MTVKPPDRLPTSVNDLDEWSVYADFLQTRGDPRGERIAYELALPAEPEPAALRVFHTLASDARRFPVGVQAAVSLGHVRALMLRASPGPRLSHGVYGPLDGTLAWVRDFFLDPEAALVEELHFVYVPGDHIAHWKRLFAALPRRCSRVDVFLRVPIGAPDIAALISLLPEQVREVTIAWADSRRPTAASVETALPFIDDRFELVDASSMMASLAQIRERLEASKHVRIRIATTTETSLPSRIDVGRPGDAALTNPSTLAIGTIPRWPLLDLQRRYGVLPIRTQLARQIAESYTIGVGAGGDLRVGLGGGDLVRRGDRWTVRGDEERPLWKNGTLLAANAVEPLEDGDRLRFDHNTSEWTFRPSYEVGSKSLVRA